MTLLSLELVTSASNLLLFTDDASLESYDSDRIAFQMHRPTKYGRVIKPDKPWESWAVFAYNHVLEMPDGEKRMYYDCIEGTGVPPGSGLGDLSHRRICLATSKDGIVWDKPDLGIFE